MENFRIYEEKFEGTNGTFSNKLYQYDKNGFLIKTIEKGSEEKIFYDDGFKKSIIENFEEETQYLYDMQGYLFKTESNRDNKLVSYKMFYYYDRFICDYSGKKKPTKVEFYISRKVTSGNGVKIEYFLHRYFNCIYYDDFLIKIIDYKFFGEIDQMLINQEFIIQYDDKNNRVRTLRANFDVVSSRAYDKNGLLMEINLTKGGKVTFSWEKGNTNYEYDMYLIC